MSAAKPLYKLRKGRPRHDLAKAYTATIKKIPKTLSSHDNLTPSRITEPKRNHPD